jgi:hypothetical protein
VHRVACNMGLEGIVSKRLDRARGPDNVSGGFAIRHTFPSRSPDATPSRRVRDRDQHQRGPKIYSLHAPEVECIGCGKACAAYEFGCKVSITTPVTPPKGGQFVLHAKALHGNPYDGHTLSPVTPIMSGSPVSRFAVSMSTGAIAATAIHTAFAFGSPVRYAPSPNRRAAAQP